MDNVSKKPKLTAADIETFVAVAQTDMPDEQMKGISCRISNAYDGEEDPTNRGLFKVITTAQLLKMRGVDMDTIERLHRHRGSTSTTIHKEKHEAL
jgi:hypothetical protein